MKRLGIAVLVLAGCTSHSGNEATSVIAGSGALGITQLQVSESAGELQIHAIDGTGAEVGALLLTEGQVTIPEDELAGEGRSLTVQVHGRQIEHKSVGTMPLELPLLKKEGAEISTFLKDPAVASLVAKRGITFTAQNPPAAPDAERAYGTCTYNANAACGATSCCQYGYTFQDVCCGTSHVFVNRTCSGYPGYSQCGTNGPQGCAVCWSMSFSSSCSTANDGGGCDYTVDGNTTQCEPTGTACYYASCDCYENCTECGDVYGQGPDVACAGCCNGYSQGGGDCWASGNSCNWSVTTPWYVCN